MRSFYLFTLMFSVIFSNIACAEQEIPALKQIEELKVEELNFDHLPKESQVGRLSELVKEEKESESPDHFLECLRTHLVLHPYAETLAYVNGQLCHVSNYSHSVIYTVLEGPYYGTQTTMTYQGAILYVNYDYTLEYTSGGVVLHHYYSDSEVVTGSNQVIIFY